MRRIQRSLLQHSRHPYNLWQPCPIWGQISENATAAADSSITLNRSASAMSMRTMPTSQYLVGSGKADITGAAAETGMFGYAAG